MAEWGEYVYASEWLRVQMLLLPLDGETCWRCGLWDRHPRSCDDALRAYAFQPWVVDRKLFKSLQMMRSSLAAHFAPPSGTKPTECGSSDDCSWAAAVDRIARMCQASGMPWGEELAGEWEHDK